MLKFFVALPLLLLLSKAMMALQAWGGRSGGNFASIRRLICSAFESASLIAHSSAGHGLAPRRRHVLDRVSSRLLGAV